MNCLLYNTSILVIQCYHCISNACLSALRYINYCSCEKIIWSIKNNKIFVATCTDDEYSVVIKLHTVLWLLVTNKPPKLVQTFPKHHNYKCEINRKVKC